MSNNKYLYAYRRKRKRRKKRKRRSDDQKVATNLTKMLTKEWPGV
jgi:hypothetical protein